MRFNAVSAEYVDVQNQKRDQQSGENSGVHCKKSCQRVVPIFGSTLRSVLDNLTHDGCGAHDLC